MTGFTLSYPLLVRFAKTGLMRFVGHLDWLRIQHAMFVRAGLPLGKSEGPTHRLKTKTSPPTPVGVASTAEFTYVLLNEPIYPEEAARRLSEHCPEGVKVMAVRDAGHLERKNPFGTIEAASYSVEFGDELPDGLLDGVEGLLRSIQSGEPPEGVDQDDVKQFWARIIEIERHEGGFMLLVHQREAVTFHAAKCATYLEKTLSLPHYPLFTKLDYYRLKPNRRKLFR